MRNLIKSVIREYLNEQKDFNSDIMKNLIIQGLNDAFSVLEKQVPQTRKKTKTISIEDVKPSQLLSFMKSNDIPNDAYFSGGGSGDDIVLAWEVDVPTTEKEKLEYKNRRFHDIAFKSVYDLLTPNGYKRTTDNDRGRITYNRSTFPAHIMFDNKTVYEMYVDKDFDSLLEYYSMYFKKEV
jgi:hypothetical protein